MTEAMLEAKRPHRASPVRKLDALIIGAGVAGLYQLHLLREPGIERKAYDSASDVGGTWYWNRYPGARFDSEAYIYQYLFSEELYKGWSWSERFPGQPEIERWMHYVADRLDLRKDIQFDTTITERRITMRRPTAGRSRPTRGETIDTQFLDHLLRDALGADEQCCSPGRRPSRDRSSTPRAGRAKPVDFAGKRVGVVGIGATGIQVIQTIASQVGHLKVFVRTPQYALP